MVVMPAATYAGCQGVITIIPDIKAYYLFFANASGTQSLDNVHPVYHAGEVNAAPLLFGIGVMNGDDSGKALIPKGWKTPYFLD